MKKLIGLILLISIAYGCSTERQMGDPTHPKEAHKRQKEIQRELNSPKFD